MAVNIADVGIDEESTKPAREGEQIYSSNKKTNGDEGKQ